MSEIPCPLAESASRFPNSTAIEKAKVRISFAELDNLSGRAATYFTTQGIKSGEIVALIGDVGIRWVAAFFGLLRIGAIVNPLSHRLPLQGIQDRLFRLNVKQTFVFDKLSVDPLKSDCTAKAFPPAERLAHLEILKTKALFTETPAVAVFTSGSTARPKAAILSLGNLIFSAKGLNRFMDLRREDTWLLSLPVHHAAGLGILFRTMLASATLLVRGGAETVETAVAGNDVTHLSLVSTQLPQLLEDSTAMDKARANLKAVLLGGSMFPACLLERALEARLPLYLSYGLTEMSSTVAARRLTSPLTLSCGRALPYRKIRIAASGEIEVAGETLFLGYHNEPGESKTPDGWFRTGDSGVLNENGELTVTGRIDNLIISGGENIRPEEIESALCSLDGIREAFVVALADKRYGQRPVAFLRTEECRPIDESRLRTELSATLESFKIPDHFFEVPKDRDDSFKPRRVDLANLAEKKIKETEA